TENSLVQCISDIRAALGEEGPVLLKTVPRRGYMFTAPLVEDEPAPGEPAPPETTPIGPPPIEPAVLAPASRRYRRPALLAALIALPLIGVGATAWWWWEARDSRSEIVEPARRLSIALLP